MDNTIDYRNMGAVREAGMSALKKELVSCVNKILCYNDPSYKEGWIKLCGRRNML
jgi:hypothetical protein